MTPKKPNPKNRRSSLHVDLQHWITCCGLVQEQTTTAIEAAFSLQNSKLLDVNYCPQIPLQQCFAFSKTLLLLKRLGHLTNQMVEDGWRLAEHYHHLLDISNPSKLFTRTDSVGFSGVADRTSKLLFDPGTNAVHQLTVCRTKLLSGLMVDHRLIWYRGKWHEMKWCAVWFFAYLHSVTSNMTRCILQSQQLVDFVSREVGGRKILAWKWWKFMEINMIASVDLLKFGGLFQFWILGIFSLSTSDYSNISSRSSRLHRSFLGYFINPDRRLPQTYSW